MAIKFQVIEDRKRLAEIIKQDQRLAERAATRTMKQIADGNKREKRQQVLAAQLGRRLANTVRGNVYPKNTNSLGAAAVVQSKVDWLHVFTQGAVIRSKDGFWLAIPTENAPKKGVGGKRINPSNFPEHRFGPLRFVYRPGKAALLVVDNVRQSFGKRGGFVKASASIQKRGFASRNGQTAGVATVVMFVLVPQVRLKKRLNFDAIDDKYARLVARLFFREFERLER